MFVVGQGQQSTVCKKKGYELKTKMKPAGHPFVVRLIQSRKLRGGDGMGGRVQSLAQRYIHCK